MPGNPYEAMGGYYGAYSAPPLYGTVPPPRPPGFFNLGQPSGPIEGLAQSLLPMLAEMLRGQVGGSVFTFGSDMNALSAKFAQQFVTQINQARTVGAELDRPQLNQLLSGFARVIGNDLRDPQVRGAIDRLSGDLTGMLPILAAVFPDQVDRWLPNGSMSVAAASFVSAGRFVIDPQTGLPVSNDPNYGPRVVRDLLAGGPRTTSGLGAGRIGQIYEQLVARGLVDSGTDLREMVESGEMTGSKARAVQADRVKTQLSSYSKAIAAINDIFADMGRPNTPMGELFAALEKLTAGGSGTMTSDRLARTVRMAQAVSNMTGMSTDAQSALTGQIAAGLQQGGRPTSLAPYLSQYTAVMGRVYSDAGLVFGGPEGQTLNDVVSRRAQLGVAGANSDAARSIGTVLALADSAAEGSPIRHVADAIRARQTSVTIGGRTYDPLRLNPEQINDLAARSGLGAGAFQAQMMAPNQVNAALANNPEAADWAIRALQAGEARTLFGQWVGQALPGMAPADVGRAYELMQAQIAKGGFDSDRKLVDLVGDQMGLDAEQRLRLKTTIGMFGGWQKFSDANPILNERADRRMKIAEGRATAAELMTWRNRGGIMRRILSSVVEAGEGVDRSPLGWALRGLGLVFNDEMTGDLTRAAGGDKTLMDDLFGMVGMKPSDLTPDVLKTAKDMDPEALRAMMIARDMGGLIMNNMGGRPAARADAEIWKKGFGRDDVEVAPRPREVGGRVGADRPANVRIDMTGVKIEIAGDRVSLTGTGAMRETA